MLTRKIIISDPDFPRKLFSHAEMKRVLEVTSQCYSVPGPNGSNRILLNEADGYLTGTSDHRQLDYFWEEMKKLETLAVMECLSVTNEIEIIERIALAKLNYVYENEITFPGIKYALEPIFGENEINRIYACNVKQFRCINCNQRALFFLCSAKMMEKIESTENKAIWLPLLEHRKGFVENGKK